jgi:hypothetical protein
MYNNYMWVMEVLTSLAIINHYIVVVSFTEGRNHINHSEVTDKVNVVSSTPRHG